MTIPTCVRSTTRRLSLCAAFVCGFSLSAAALAAGGASAPGPMQPMNVLADAILDRWAPIAVQAEAHTPAWREIFGTQLRLMDAATLDGVDAVQPDAASAKANYAKFAGAIRNAEFKSYMAGAAGKGPMKLASTSTDQTFVPIVPCRIVDTRNVGGPIAASTTRNFLFYSTGASDDWSDQGGIAGPTAATCPGTILPNGGVNSPSAAVVTVTVVSPSAAGNWVLWGGASPTPTASALNWAGPGQILANTT